jgi:tRNA dimethylallyltransferase
MSSPDQSQQEVTESVSHQKVPLVIIIGPTAVGKTEIAIQLAEKVEGEIVSADSRLFYRGMDIGTAKPSFEDRQRVPHHLIDVAEPDETWSLALFQLEARRVIAEVISRQHLPILVGGTGQFVRSVSEGWSIPRVEPNPQLRQALEHWANRIGPEQMHASLAALDTEAAEAIDYHNVRRTIRALEVIFSTGRRFSDQKQRGYQLYNSIIIGLTRPRAELYQRIDDRIAMMIASGLIEEVQRLLDLGYSPELPTLSAIGYGEIVSYLSGKITLDEAIMLMKRRTRNFVRKQANWFKPEDPSIHWFQVNSYTTDEITEFVLGWLRSEKP